MIEKSSEAFRTISEVAEELDLPQHVLRFWETRFAQIKPMKRGGGRRYYRPEDVNLLKGIRFLLYSEGYTIKGVQRILKEQGVRHVASVWEMEGQEPEEAPAATAQLVPAPPAEYSPEPEPVAMEPRAAAVQRTAAQTPVQRSRQLRSAAAEPATAPIPAAPQPAPVPPTAAPPAMASPQARLSQDDVRQLKAALFELIECKRLLDATTQAGTA